MARSRAQYSAEGIIMKKAVAIVVLAAGVVIVGRAQAVTGKWASDPVGGGVLGLDLTISGTTLTGTVVATQPGGVFSSSIANGSVSGNTIAFSATIAGRTAAFTGEVAEGQITLRMVGNSAAPALILRRVQVLPTAGAPAVATTPLPITTPGGWRSGTRSAESVEEVGRTFLRVRPAPGEGVVWLEGSDFRNGTIEVEMRGRDVQGQSFVGVAFRGIDDMTYDAVYFRPFNFKTEDSERVRRAVQYHSSPNFPWAKLRADNPNMYEKPVSPAPDPGSWFRAKIVIEERAVNVYVNDSKRPTLSVTALSEPRAGMVGLWLGNASPGDFANLTLRPQ
jgi:hypothetical protein